MDDVAQALVKAIPSLALLGILVFFFIRYIERRDVRDAEISEKHDLVLRGIGESCHTVQRESVEAINQNTKMLGEVGHILEQAAGVLKSIDANGKRAMK